jgi:FMN phosphatase YigB (HAD superfamily)
MIQVGKHPEVSESTGLDQRLERVNTFGLDHSEAGSRIGLELFGQALTASTKLISFDVFETLITRSTGSHEAEFFFIGQRLREIGLIQCSAEAFAQTRYDCEKRARRNNPGREITLREIYEEITCFFDIESSLDAMIQVELDVETQAIEVVPSMIGVVDQARERFGKVIFVSDMYLPQTFLEERLVELGLFKPGDRLYVSSSEGVQKGDTRLFKVVLEQENLKPAELFHVGNSPAYDIEPAKKMGIGHHFFNEGNPHPSEVVLNRFANSTDGLAALMGGSARRARLQGLHLNGGQRAIWESGACVTGPLVWMYAQWVVSRAEQKGIKQLYFLARDAYPVYLAVKHVLQNKPDTGIKVRYIYGSRPTYYALGIKTLGEKQWDRLTVHGNHRYNTLNTLCAALMIQPETMRNHLGPVGLTDVDWDAVLTTDQLDQLRKHAIEDGDFNQAVLDDLRAYHDQQRKYFEQQDFKPEDGLALVDSGWTSRSHAPLFNFLKDMGCENLRLFYIGLIVKKPFVPMDAIDTFMFNHASNQGIMSHRMVYTRALETLFTSFHGRTSSFVQKDGFVEPVFAPIEDPTFTQRYTEEYIRGVRAFLDQMQSIRYSFDAIHNMRKISEQLLSRFWNEPTVAEAQVWSQLTWEWDPLGQIRHSLSKPYRPQDMVKAFIQNRAPVLYPQFWVAAAKVLTPSHTLVLLRSAIAVRRGAERLLGLIPGAIRNPVTKARRKLLSFKHH